MRFSPIPFLRFRALGAELAVEAAKVHAVVEMTPTHVPSYHGPGLVMVHEGAIIPLVDYRLARAPGACLHGEQVLVLHVYRRKFGIVVDRVGARTAVRYPDIRLPDAVLARQYPYLAGYVEHGEDPVYLIDSDRLLGPAVRKYLLKGTDSD